MADDIIGGANVKVGADLSDLPAEFAKAVAAAEAAGQDIGSAISKAYEGGASNLKEALNQIVNSAQGLQQAAQPMGQAVETAAQSIQGAGEAASAAGGKLNEFSGHVQSAGGAAHETHGSTQELLTGLLEFAGIGLGIEAIKEFAQECVNAFAAEEKFSIGLKFLIGDAAVAEEAMASLGKQALDLGIADEKVYAAAQRMVASGLDISQVSVAVQAAADAAAATGDSFDTAAQKLNNMALSGQVSGRALTALGLNMNDLAGVMQVGTDQVKQAFQNMNVEERMDVMILALNKFKGAGEEMAKGTAGQLTTLKTEFENMMEDIGKAISPLVLSALPALKEGFKGILAAGDFVVTGLKLVIDAIVGLVSVGGAAVTGFNTAFDQLASGHFKDAARTFTDTIANVKTAVKATTDAMVADSTAGAEFLKTLYKEEGKAATDSGKEQREATDVVAAAHRSLGGELEKFKALLPPMSDGIKVLVEQQKLWTAEHEATLKAIAKSGLSIDEFWNKKLDAANESMRRFSDLEEPIIANSGLVETAILKAGTAMEKLGLMGPALDPLQQAFVNLGLQVDGTGGKVRDAMADFDTIANDPNSKLPGVEAAWAKVSGAVSKLAKEDLPEAIRQEQIHIAAMQAKGATFQDLVGDLQQLYQWQVKLAQEEGRNWSESAIKLAEVRRHQQDLIDSTGLLYKAYQDVMKVTDETFKALGSAVSSAIVDGKNLGEELTNAFKKIAKEIIDDLIGMALNPLKNALKDLIGGAFGGGGGLLGSLTQGATSAGGALGSVASGATAAGSAATTAAGGLTSAGSAASGVGGAFGSLGGTINVISGAVSAVTGVIGLFQNAAMHATEKLVEMNTRISAIVESKELPLSNQIAVEQEGTLQDISTHTAPIPDIAQHTFWAAQLLEKISNTGIPGLAASSAAIASATSATKTAVEQALSAVESVEAAGRESGKVLSVAIDGVIKQLQTQQAAMLAAYNDATRRGDLNAASLLAVQIADNARQIADLDKINESVGNTGQKISEAVVTAGERTRGAIQLQEINLTTALTATGTVIAAMIQQEALANRGAIAAASGKTGLDLTATGQAIIEANRGASHEAGTTVASAITTVATPAITATTNAVNNAATTIVSAVHSNGTTISQSTSAAIIAAQQASSAAFGQVSGAIAQVAAAILSLPAGGSQLAGASGQQYQQSLVDAGYNAFTGQTTGPQFTNQKTGGISGAEGFAGGKSQGADSYFNALQGGVPQWIKDAASMAMNAGISLPINIQQGAGDAAYVLYVNPDGTVGKSNAKMQYTAGDTSFRAPGLDDWMQRVAALGFADFSAQLGANFAGATAAAKSGFEDALPGLLPKFASGIDSVPYDMAAIIHKGEQIRPANVVDDQTLQLAQLVELTADVLAEMEALNYKIPIWEPPSGLTNPPVGIPPSGLQPPIYAPPSGLTTGIAQDIGKLLGIQRPENIGQMLMLGEALTAQMDSRARPPDVTNRTDLMALEQMSRDSQAWQKNFDLTHPAPPPIAFARMPFPSFDGGLDYAPYDMTARIHQGERVLTRAENAAHGAAGAGDTYIINVDGGGFATCSSCRRQAAEGIASHVKSVTYDRQVRR